MSKVILGRKPRKTKPNRTVVPPTQATSGTYSGDYREWEFGGTTTPDLLVPLNAVSGDHLYLAVRLKDGGEISAVTGWTQIHHFSTAFDNTEEYVYYKVSDGTETDTTFTLTSAADGTAISWRLRAGGATLGTPTDVTDAGGSFGSTDPPSVSPSDAPGTFAVFIVVMGNGGPNNGPAAPPTGYETVDDIVKAGIGRQPYVYLGRSTTPVAITTSEDPGDIGGFDDASFYSWRATTIATRLDSGAPAVMPGDTDHGDIGGLADDDHTQYLNTARHNAIDAADHGSGAAGDGQVLTADGAGGAAWEDASGGVTDHGALTGLADDDHTQYSLASGTRAFTGTVSGVTPTATAHLATKGYVDTQAAAAHKELLMQDGVTAPPVPIETEARDDWLYED